MQGILQGEQGCECADTWLHTGQTWQDREAVCARARFSMLWAPVSAALGVALGAAPNVAWPLVLRALADTQADFLAGRGGGEAG